MSCCVAHRSFTAIVIVIAAVSFVIATSGCERSPVPSPAPTDASAASSTDPANPTVQPLGPSGDSNSPTTQSPAAFAPIRLSYFPLTVEAPRNWQIKSFVNGDVVFLQGPAPSGEEVQIQLSHRGRVTAEQLILRQNATTREAAEHSESVKLAEVRTSGPLTIFDQQSLGKEIVSLTDSRGNALPDTVNYRWTIHVFAPRESDFDDFELNFVGLTADQFKKDSQFLKRVMSSIKTVDEAPAPPPGVERRRN